MPKSTSSTNVDGSRRLLAGDLDSLVTEPLDPHDLDCPDGGQSAMVAPVRDSSRVATI